MNLLAMVASVIHDAVWAGVTLYAVRCVVTFASAYRAVTQPSPANVPDIPTDLMALAMQQSEPWAQEDLLRVIRERYEDLKDWNLVRSAMNIGVLAE